MKDLGNWLLTIGTLACAVLGAFYDVAPARNVYRFFVWASLPVVAIVIASHDMPRHGPRTWAEQVRRLVGFSTIPVAAAAGWFFTAGVDLLVWLLVSELDMSKATVKTEGIGA